MKKNNKQTLDHLLQCLGGRWVGHDENRSPRHHLGHACFLWPQTLGYHSTRYVLRRKANKCHMKNLILISNVIIQNLMLIEKGGFHTYTPTSDDGEVAVARHRPVRERENGRPKVFDVTSLFFKGICTDGLINRTTWIFANKIL